MKTTNKFDVTSSVVQKHTVVWHITQENGTASPGTMVVPIDKINSVRLNKLGRETSLTVDLAGDEMIFTGDALTEAAKQITCRLEGHLPNVLLDVAADVIKMVRKEWAPEDEYSL